MARRYHNELVALGLVQDEFPRYLPAYKLIQSRWPEYSWRFVYSEAGAHDKMRDRNSDAQQSMDTLRRSVIFKNIPGGSTGSPPNLGTLVHAAMNGIELSGAVRTLPPVPTASLRRGTRTLSVGRFTLHFDDEAITIPPRLVGQLEELVNRVATITTSMLVRLDMAPWDGRGEAPLFEVESTPGGLEWARLTALPVPAALPSIADSIMVTDPEWAEADKRLSQITGWKVYDAWKDIPAGAKVYIADSAAAIPPGEFELVTDPYVGKIKTTLPITGCIPFEKHYAAFLGHGPGSLIAVEEVEHKLTASAAFYYFLARYPQGFAIKPDRGGGGRGVYIYAPNHRRDRKSHTMRVIERALRDTNGTTEKWLAQQYFEPGHDERFGFRIWRIFAFRTSRTAPFQLFGGFWNARPSLKVHGAEDAVYGPVYLGGKS